MPPAKAYHGHYFLPSLRSPLRYYHRYRYRYQYYRYLPKKEEDTDEDDTISPRENHPIEIEIHTNNRVRIVPFSNPNDILHR